MTARDQFEAALSFFGIAGLADIAESHIRNCRMHGAHRLGHLRWPCREQHLTQRPPDLRYPA